MCRPVGVVPDLLLIGGDALFNSGFVRKNNLPKTLSRWNRFKRGLSACKRGLFATGMPIPNCCLVLAHLLEILLTGTPLVLIAAWAIVETSFLSPGVNTPVFSFADILSPNSTNPWWRENNGMIVMGVCISIVCVFSVLALL